MAQPHPMEPVDTPPEFLPLSSEVERPDIAVDRIDAPGRLCEAVDVHGELESREVPPSPDEAEPKLVSVQTNLPLTRIGWTSMLLTEISRMPT